MPLPYASLYILHYKLEVVQKCQTSNVDFKKSVVFIVASTCFAESSLINQHFPLIKIITIALLCPYPGLYQPKLEQLSFLVWNFDNNVSVLRRQESGGL